MYYKLERYLHRLKWYKRHARISTEIVWPRPRCVEGFSSVGPVSLCKAAVGHIGFLPEIVFLHSSLQFTWSHFGDVIPLRLYSLDNHTQSHTHAHTHTHTTVLRLYGFCPGQPGWAGTRRNIHPLTLIVVINH